MNVCPENVLKTKKGGSAHFGKLANQKNIFCLSIMHRFV